MVARVERVGWTQALGQGAVGLGFLVLCFWLARDHVAALDAGKIGAALAGLGPLQWLGGLGASGLAFLAVAGQEREANRMLGLPDHRVKRAGITAAAVGQAVGMGPVVGTILRMRLRPDLSLLQAAALSTSLSFGFLAGLGLLVCAVLLAVPQDDAMIAAVAGGGACAVLAGAVGAIWLFLRKRGGAGLSLSGGLRFFCFVFLDIAALFLAFAVLLPPDVVIGFSTFLLAFAAGLLSGAPAGVGPFEAMIFSHAAENDTSSLAAGILSFRLVAYAIPALCGMVFAYLAAPVARAVRRVRHAPVLPDLGDCPRAEVMLARQGHLSLYPVMTGVYWLRGAVGWARVWLGDPVAATHLPRDTRGLIPVRRHGLRPDVLYKIGARTAARARGLGHSLLHIADEAVIDPRDFATQGPDHANLRRKLRRAAKSGIGAGEAAIPPLSALPLDAMESVHREWCARHGAERGFSMGVWDRDYIAAQRVFLAWDAAGELVAFASFHATSREWVLDLIRFRASAPDGTLYALIVAAIAAAGQAGVPRFSLAAAPVQTGKGLLGRIVARLSRKGRGLRQFKATFAPRWEPRYIATRQSWMMPVALLLLAGRINRRQKAAPVATIPEEAADPVPGLPHPHVSEG